jgi:hypothetical protein
MIINEKDKRYKLMTKEKIDDDIKTLEEKYISIKIKEDNIKQEKEKILCGIEKKLDDLRKEKKYIKQLLKSRENMTYCEICHKYIEKRNFNNHNDTEIHKKNKLDSDLYCNICDKNIKYKNFGEHIDCDMHKKNALDIKLGLIERKKNYDIHTL